MYEQYEILIVEDNPSDAELMLHALKKGNLGNKLIVVEDGKKALDFIFCEGEFSDKKIDDKPKVIFLDIKLPKVNGLEVLKKIKANELTKTIPVVMVTSSNQDPDIEKAYKYGANSYVVKPIDFKHFSDTLTQLGMYWLAVNKVC